VTLGVSPSNKTYAHGSGLPMTCQDKSMTVLFIQFRLTYFRSYTYGVLVLRCAKLALGHLLGHVENELAIGFLSLAQQAAKFAEITSVLTSAAPSDVIGRLPLG
jgi:hypothetical protein